MKEIATRVGAVLILVIAIGVTMGGCNSNAETSEFTKNGYLVGPAGLSCKIKDPYRTVSYTVLSESEYEKLDEDVSRATEKVKKWWNNSTFVEPKIVPVQFSTDSNVRGFADDGYIFIDPSNADYLETIIHEMIHLQNENGLIWENDLGRELMEMVVEETTIRIMGEDFKGVPTDNQKFFKACPKLYQKYKQLVKAFKNGEEPTNTYTKLFGSEAKYVCEKLNSWNELPNVLNEKELKTFCFEYLGIDPSELMKIYQNIN